MRRSHPKIEAPQSILILKPSSFGDIIHTLPAVARLKTAWPSCRFSWLVNPEWAPLLTENPDVNEVILFPRQTFRGWAGPSQFLRWCHTTVVGRKPTLALDFQGLLRSAFIGRLSGPRTLYGMADAREGARWIYDRVAPVPTGVPHAVERYLSLAETVLQSLGHHDDTSVEPPLRFPLPEGDPPRVETERLRGGFILLHPFARGAGKSLTRPQIEEFCRWLAPRQVVLVGRRGDCRFDVPSTTVDLCDGTTLTQLIWVMRRASCVVSVDSGPSHLAVALGRPLVAIHTWSDPRRVGPYRDDAWVWKNGCLLPMAQMRSQEATLFQQPLKVLSREDVNAICTKAISLSDSCA